MSQNNSNSLAIPPVQPMSTSTAPVKRRVNFYFAKPKERTTAKAKNDALLDPKSLLNSSVFRMKTTSNFEKKKFNETEIGYTAAAGRFGAETCQTYQTVERYRTNLDKNFSSKVHALINELDSKDPILLRNSFLTEDPVAWQLNHPFTKMQTKRSLNISSANYLQFDEPLSTAEELAKKDFLQFPVSNLGCHVE